MPHEPPEEFGPLSELGGRPDRPHDPLQPLTDIGVPQPGVDVTTLEAFIRKNRPELLDALAVWLAPFVEGRRMTQSFAELREEAGVSFAELREVARFAGIFEEGTDPTEALRRVEAMEEEEQLGERAALIQRYTQEAGYQGVKVTDSGEIFALDPETGLRSIELNATEYQITPISTDRRFDPTTGGAVPLAFPEPLPYLLDLSYEIKIPIDDYMAMLRVLDPEVKIRLTDQARVQAYFERVEFAGSEEATRQRRFGIETGVEGGTFTHDFFDPFDPGDVPVGGKYAAGDESRLFVTKSTEYVAFIQGLMIKGNILTRNDIAQNGSWGMAEEAAIQPHLFAADRRGMAIIDWLTEVSENPLPPNQPIGFTQPVYAAPDYATLSQNTKNVFRTQLGREPEPYEMGDLIMQMEQDHFADYQQQVDAARMEWNARFQASETGIEQQTGTVRDVDPFARMKEMFDAKFGPERERQEDVQEHGANVGLLMNNLAGIERQVEGG